MALQNVTFDSRLKFDYKPKESNWSPLHKARANRKLGDTYRSFCPYGCESGQLDQQGYCKHLVGFTNDGKVMEPVADDPNQKGRKVVVGDVEEAQRRGLSTTVLKTDHLERMSTSWFVFRDIPETKGRKEA